MNLEQERAAKELFARAQSGDPHAYADLLTLLGRIARQRVRASVGPVMWAEDVVQEVLIAVHRARRTYDAGRPFAPWFHAILKNRIVDAVRRERRIGAREVPMDPLPAQMTIATETEAPLDPRVLGAMQALPPRQRAVIEGLKLRDESVKEVSARLGMSTSNVKVAAHRGYATLRRLLRAKGEER